MNRRSFFGRVVGALVAVKVAPKSFDAPYDSRRIAISAMRQGQMYMHMHLMNPVKRGDLLAAGNDGRIYSTSHPKAKGRCVIARSMDNAPANGRCLVTLVDW